MKRLAFAFFALALSIAPAVGEESAYHVGDVCIDPPTQTSSIATEQPADFTLVDIARGNAGVARIYIGDYPAIDRDVFERAARAGAGLYPIDQAPHHQYLMVSSSHDEPYLHIMFGEIAPAEQQLLLHHIRFCPSARHP